MNNSTKHYKPTDGQNKLRRLKVNGRMLLRIENQYLGKKYSTRYKKEDKKFTILTYTINYDLKKGTTHSSSSNQQQYIKKKKNFMVF